MSIRGTDWSGAGHVLAWLTSQLITVMFFPGSQLMCVGYQWYRTQSRLHTHKSLFWHSEFDFRA
ncbi:hypothetical protein M378DRAFT_381746 [Amanita muscaria Koide BX008]|uniref:Uncharacterized protein n=1 Tax=Amanita muscaria (strain Koide BX008) TaxID=946122 RepID=A0A0C2WLI5_AMAMK|nr:hypothetical protein M378DRAFT_381746 [Amanita muscaria Koide BX008]